MNYLTYLNHTIATIAESRREQAKRQLFDLQGCNLSETAVDAECLWLMAFALSVEQSDALIPYLADRGVGCTASLCPQTELIVSAGTGLFTPRPGSGLVVIGTDGNDGLIPDTVPPPPAVELPDGQTITPEQIEQWTKAYLAVPPADLTYRIGFSSGGPVAGESTFVHPLFKGWHVRLLINRLEQYTVDDGSGFYYSKPLDSDTLTLHGAGYQWVADDMVKIEFYRGAENLNAGSQLVDNPG